MLRFVQCAVLLVFLAGPAAAKADEYRNVDPEAQPAWAVPYGEEFWRRPQPGVLPRAANSATELPAPGNFDVGDVIERVSHALQPGAPGEPPALLTASFAATLEAGGVTLEPLASGGVAGTGAVLSFRSRSLLRGDSVVWSMAEPEQEWSVLGNVAQRRLDPSGGVIEHYEFGRAGIEATWLLAGPPAGTGPLFIEAEVVGAESAEQTPAGLRCVLGAGQPAVLVGNAVAVDSAGTRWALVAAWTGGSVVFEVPDLVLATAVYPLALDPTVGPELSLLGPAPGSQTMPAVASNGTDFLVVWGDSRDAATGPDVYGTRVSAAGAVLDPGGIPIATDRLAPLMEGHPDVASTGGDYLVVWTTGDILGALVRSSDALVTPLAAPISAVAGAFQFDPAVAASGGRYLVVWEHSVGGGQHDVWGRPVDSNGGFPVPPGSVDFSLGDKGELAVAARGAAGFETFLVGWQNVLDGRVYAVRTDRDGAEATAFPIDSGAGTELALASDGADYVATWTSGGLQARFVPLAPAQPLGVVQLVDPGAWSASLTWQGSSYFSVFRTSSYGGFGRRLDSTATPIDPAFAFGWNSVFPGWLDVASNGTQSLVVASDPLSGPLQFDIHGVLVTSGGVVLTPETLLSGDTAYSQGNPSIAANSTFYMVVWEDYRHTRAETFAARVRIADGSLKDPSGIQIPVPADSGYDTYSFKFPDVASNGTDFLVTWGNERLQAPPPPKASWTYRTIEATLIRGADVPVPVILPTVTMSTTSFNSVPAVAWQGTHFFVAWESNRNSGTTGWDIYGNWVKEAAGGGSLRFGAEIPVNTTPGDQRWADVAGLPGTQNYSYLVTWYDGRNYSGVGYDIWASRVREDGGAWEVCFNQAVTKNVADDQTYAAAATNGLNTFVVWQDKRNNGASGTDIWGSKLAQSNSGACAWSTQLLLYANTPITQALNNQIFPAIASDGTGYLVGWPDYGSNGDLFVSQVDSAGGVVNPNGIGVAAGPLMAPALAGGATDTYLSGYWRMPGSVPQVMLRTLTSPWP